MNQQDFSGVKVGDRLWSIQLGECEVYDKKEDYVRCRNNYKDHAYYFNGNYMINDSFNSLFWSNPNIQIPERPKKKVKKEVCVSVKIFNNGSFRVWPFETNEESTQPIFVERTVMGILTYEIEE